MLTKPEIGIVYISGRMTGTEDHGAAMFTEARERLRAEGFTVLCPSEASISHNTTEKRSREFHLRRDVSMVMLADQVCVLPAWERSKGAAIEVMLAVAIGIPVWEYDTREVINGEVLETMDPRRFIVPVDFEEWYVEDIDPAAFKAEYQGEHVVERCTYTHAPFRGASALRCDRAEGHRGPHEVEGRAI